MANTNLSKAKSAKNDEFYTQYADIQKEVNAYLDYDANVFRGKTILLPCDDPEWSNFTKFFAQNFERFGLKKLISTSYAIESKNVTQVYQPTLFETAAPQFDRKKTRVRGKIFVLDHDTNKNGRIDIEDLEWDYLKGDGDFRSDEVKKLRDEADIKAVYAKQTAAAEKKGVSNCSLCAIGHAANRTRIYKFAEMDADHVTAWTMGGATDIRNCQMLCKTHNRAKGNR